MSYKIRLYDVKTHSINRNLKKVLSNSELEESPVIRNFRITDKEDFFGICETLYNMDFNPLEFDGFRKQAGLNAFILSPMLNKLVG